MPIDDERVEGPHYCYGTVDDPHTPVRTVSVSADETFRCPICGREADPAEAALDLEEERERQRQAAPAIAVEQIRAGSEPDSIVSMLEGRGLGRGEAEQLVHAIGLELTRVTEAEAYTSAALLRAIFGGLIAAVLAGVGWGLLVITSGYEIGFAATGVGLLTGFAVVLSAQGGRGVPLQAVAVFASALGILIGKYLTFFYLYRDAVEKNVGGDAADRLSPFASKVFHAFVDNLDVVFSGYDLLWIGLAVLAAWRIPRGFRLRSGAKF